MGRQNPDLYSFSHSEMETYKQCRRKWYLQYFRGLRRKSNQLMVARDTGVLVHAALHTFYVAGGLNAEGTQDLMFEYLKNARDEDLLKVDNAADRKIVEETHELGRILCTGYLEWLHETGADIGLKLDKSEVTLSAPGPVEGTQIMGIIDLGGTHELSGDIVVMDTKVTDSIDAMIKMLHMSEQGPNYALLAKINDENPDRGFRVIWNMIKRNKQTARAKPPFYQRYELAINTDQLRQFYLQLHGQISDILRTEERLNNGESHVAVAYPTPSKDCTWKCPYFSICGTMNDLKNNDVEYLIGAYFTTPEQREDDRVEPEQELILPGR